MERTPRATRASTPPSSCSCKRSENIFKVEVSAKSASASTEAEAAERATAGPTRPSTRAAKATGTAVECGRAVRVVGFLLLRIRQQLVRGLRFGELVFGAGVLVRVRVVLLREAIVCLLDLRCGCVLVDAEN